MNSFNAMIRGTLGASASWLVWPVFMGLAVWGLFALDPSLCIAPLLIFGVSASQFAGLVTLEQVLPIDLKWGVFGDPQKFSHIGHTLVSQAGAAGGTAIAVWLAQLAQRAEASNAGLWPDDWPFLVQMAIALLVYEFFAYWLHRAYHQLRLLWPLHALHHSTERMNVLVTGRIHALSSLTNKTLLLAPLYLAGAPDEVFVATAAINLWSANLAHANIKMRFLPGFAHVVTTNETHHLHHDRDLAVGNSNYGQTLLVYDQIFGTFKPAASKPRVEVGVTDDPVARNFWAELFAPLIWPYLVRRQKRAMRDMT